MALTKTDLQEINKLLDNRFYAQNEWLEQKFEAQNEWIEQKFADQKDDLLTIKDEIMKELKDMREDQETHQASHARINGELEDHEERIAKLEQPAV